MGVTRSHHNSKKKNGKDLQCRAQSNGNCHDKNDGALTGVKTVAKASVLRRTLNRVLNTQKSELFLEDLRACSHGKF